MTEDEINAVAEAMALQHQQDIINARANLVKDMLAAGYNPKDWVICDNILDIQAGRTLQYHCYASKRNPTEL